MSQTYGREVKAVRLENNTQAMEDALKTVLNYSIVPPVVDESLDSPAYYDPEKLELAINPAYPDNEAFAAIAAEVAHSRMHAKGVNTYYSRAECDLDAQSVSYILCKRYGIRRETPDLSHLKELYDGWSPEEVRRALDSLQGLCKQMGNSIDRNLELLDAELKAYAAGIGLDYVTNDDSMKRPFDAPPVIVNYFYHEQIKKSARKGGGSHA